MYVGYPEYIPPSDEERRQWQRWAERNPPYSIPSAREMVRRLLKALDEVEVDLYLEQERGPSCSHVRDD